MRHTRATRLALLALFAVGCGSSDPTQIIVGITTDFTVPTEMNEVEIVVDGTPGVTQDDQPGTLLLEDEWGLPDAFTLVPAKDKDLSTDVRIDVEGRLGNEVLVQRTVVTRFLEGESKILVIHLGRDCLGLFCDAGDRTCLEGTCRSNAVDPEALPDYSRPRDVDDLIYGDGSDGGTGSDGGIPPDCEPTDEICDGEDNDCDGRTDEDPIDCDLAAGFVCEGGSCIAPPDCGVGAHVCPGGTCVEEDSLNCGGCGIVCEGICTDGACDPFADLALGGWHSCAVTSASGTVYCWGGNERGQLGDGFTTSRPNPAPVLGIEEPIGRIAAGVAHTCALSRDSSNIYCWGSNTAGQLGNGMSGTTAVTAEPVVTCVNGDCIVGAFGIAAGGRHTCVASGTGTVHCWGSGDFGALGTAGTMLTQPEVPVPDVAATSIVSGSAHLYAWPDVTSGQIFAWGNNDDGQIESAPIGEAIPPMQLSLRGPAHMALGHGHSCVQWAPGDGDTGGHIRCWGNNSHGQLGTADATGIADQPGPFVDVAAGPFHTCGVLEANQQIVCWGINGQGELGPNAEIGVDRRDPAEVGIEGPTVMIEAGTTTRGDFSGAGGHTCALVQNLGLLCWGNNSHGQLGSDIEIGGFSPVPQVVAFRP